MRKIYITLSTSAILTLAIALGGCNNAEEVKKQMEEQATLIQTQLDEKLNGLQEEVNAECTALVDSLAGIQYTDYLAELKKSGKKIVTKSKPKVEAKKEEPKPTVGDGKPQMGNQNTNTIGSGKPKMGDTTKTNTIGSGKPKMGTTPK